MNGETLLYEAQGECTYREYYVGTNSYDDVHCHYTISTNADYLTLYVTSTNKLYKNFDMVIKDETTIQLQAKNLTWPYVFKKIK